MAIVKDQNGFFSLSNNWGFILTKLLPWCPKDELGGDSARKRIIRRVWLFTRSNHNHMGYIKIPLCKKASKESSNRFFVSWQYICLPGTTLLDLKTLKNKYLCYITLIFELWNSWCIFKKQTHSSAAQVEREIKSFYMCHLCVTYDFTSVHSTPLGDFKCSY